MRLDFGRPYAEVIGRPGVVFEQDGHNFRADGTCVDEAPAPIVTPPTPPQPTPRIVAQPARRQKLSASTALRHQFGEDLDMPEAPPAPQRDVLAPYRGSLTASAKSWVDGV